MIIKPDIKVKFFFLTCLLLIMANILPAQQQKVRVEYQDRSFTYRIQRYSPVWMIPLDYGNGQKLLPVERAFRNLFRYPENMKPDKIYASSESAKKSALNILKVLPELSKSKIAGYFRIKYKDSEIFIVSLNDQSARSVLPLIEQSGKWKLNIDFLEHPLYKLLQDVRFNPYTGKFGPRSLCFLGFEEISGSEFWDYSGFRNNGKVRRGILEKGVVGKCLKMSKSVSLDVLVKTDEFHYSDDFYFAAYLKLESPVNKSEDENIHWANIITTSKDGGRGFFNIQQLRNLAYQTDSLRIELYDRTGKLHQFVIPYNPDEWFHMSVLFDEKMLKVLLDDKVVKEQYLPVILDTGNVNYALGNSHSFTGKIDELIIGY